MTRLRLGRSVALEGLAAFRVAAKVGQDVGGRRRVPRLQQGSVHPGVIGSGKRPGVVRRTVKGAETGSQKRCSHGEAEEVR